VLVEGDLSKSEEFVTIHRTGDPVTGEMLEDVLRGEGFDARLLGTRNAALLGAGQSIFRLKIEVPADQAEEAAAVLEAVLSEVEGEDDEDEEFYLGDEDPPEDGPTVDRPDDAARDEYQPPRKLDSGGAKKDKDEPRPPKTLKKRALAAGLPVVMPGLGQVYAGRPWAGLMLMAGVMASFVWGMLTGDFGLFGAGYLFALLTDVIAGQFAAVAFNRGVETGVGTQLGFGIAQVAFVGALALLAIRLVG